MDTIWLIAQAILNGIAQGGVYSMIGVGLTIIVGVMRCVNYAQGEFLAVGMYLTLCLVQWTGLSSYAPVSYTHLGRPLSRNRASPRWTRSTQITRLRRRITAPRLRPCGKPARS